MEDTSYSCDFIAAPSNGETDLIEKFGKNARRCHDHPCSKRPWSKSISNICKVANPLFLPESGGIGYVLNAGGWKKEQKIRYEYSQCGNLIVLFINAVYPCGAAF